MKIYYEALSKIPPQFIHDKTQCCTVGEDKVILANPEFCPMMYKNGKWSEIETQFTPFLFNEETDKK